MVETKDTKNQIGLQFREAHYPGRAPIDAYGNGGFRFAEMSHRGSILCLPSGIYAWHVEATDPLRIASFEKVVEEADEIEILLVGSGENLVPLPEDLKQVFRLGQISADSMSTGAAVRTFNVLLSENRAVAAAFLAV